MRDDVGQEVYRKLLYYFENNIPVHFTDLDEVFYNGLILDLSESKHTLVIRERLNGELPILLECIKPSSISTFKEKVE